METILATVTATTTTRAAAGSLSSRRGQMIDHAKSPHDGGSFFSISHLTTFDLAIMDVLQDQSCLLAYWLALCRERRDVPRDQILGRHNLKTKRNDQSHRPGVLRQ